MIRGPHGVFGQKGAGAAVTSKEAKAAARRTLRGHWPLLAALCLLMALLGGEWAASVTAWRSLRTQTPPTVQTAALPLPWDMVRRLTELAQDLQGEAQRLRERETELAQSGGAALGRSRGEIARWLNKLQSGAYMADALEPLAELTGSRTAGLVMLALLCGALILFVWVFLKGVYRVLLCRMALECRVYRRVPSGRLFWLGQMKCLGRAAWCMAARTLSIALWSLTVVGGVVAHCALFPVPYLLAENPGLGHRRAMELSRRMMAGRKGEYFRFELSFWGWKALSVATFGLSGALWSRPYRQAAQVHYYVALRQAWLAENPSDEAFLNEPWLFEPPEADALRIAYGDLPPETELPRLTTGLVGFAARNFGLLLRQGPQELAYAQALEDRARLAPARLEARGLQYPTRLAANRPAGERAVDADPVRCYGLRSVVVLFFAFSMAGWLWEVLYASVDTGQFINRGVLHGPWLPIYGSGACLILLLLYRFRTRPGVEFFLAMALCGALEYATGLYLELAHDGQRWWDYAGYFLNFQGRISAEGLLAFGIAGTAAVYALAPWLDNLLKRLPRRVLTVVCAALLALFCLDLLWSAVEPNIGPGITDITVAVVRANL